MGGNVGIPQSEIASIADDPVGTPADSLGYIQYSSADALQVDESFFTEVDLIDLQVGATGSAAPKQGGGCNISFDSFMQIDFNLPDLSFEFGPAPFDRSLFDKCDALSLEVSQINNMLINTILDMGCCDIAKVYNVTMVPFFQFFADNTGGNNLITMLVKYAEIITALRAIVEALDCLIRFVPNNPWFPKDFDILAWIYGYFKESKPFLNRILSGELIDIILNPVHQMRMKLQACLSTNVVGSGFMPQYHVGSPEQLMAISRLAVSDGGQVKNIVFPNLTKPRKPTPNHYHGGATNPKYIADLKEYNKVLQEYNNSVSQKKILEAELTRQKQAYQEINQHLTVSATTNFAVKASTNGLCGCIADALGLNNITINITNIRTSSDYQSLVGKTISGLTNKQAGTASKDRPADENITIRESDISNEKVMAKCTDKGSTSNCHEMQTSTKVASTSCAYPSACGVGPTNVQATCVKAVKKNSCSTPAAGLKANDACKGSIDKLIKDDESLQGLQAKLDKEAQGNWTKDKIRAYALLSGSRPVTEQEKLEFKAAQAIYYSYFGQFNKVDLVNDPKDQKVLSCYVDETDFQTMLQSATLAAIRSSNDPKVKRIPYPPNTPPENIIKRMDVSTEVDVDQRFKVNYFNAGFVREKGSSSWRNFNRLNMPDSELARENGAIGIDRGDMYYQAIFPTDTIGNKAQLVYLRDKYLPRDTLQTLVEGELNQELKDIDNFLEELEFKDYPADTLIMHLNDTELLDIVMMLSEANGYKAGKLWLKTKAQDPELEFKADSDSSIEYTYTSINGEPFEIKAGDVKLDIPIMRGGDIARSMKDQVNTSIKNRVEYYVSSVQAGLKRQNIATSVEVMRSTLWNSVASAIPTEAELIIPCTCDNILCTILNTIIQYVLGALNRLIQELVNMIIQFLIPDWVKDLIRLVKEFLKCLGSIFGIGKTIADVSKAADDLLESLKGRIRLYPDDACFIPPDITLPPDIDLPPGDITDYDPPDPCVGDECYTGGEDPCCTLYEPPIGGGNPPGGGGPGGPNRPPVILPPGGGIEPGDPGRGIPAFRIHCDYLKL